MIKFVKAYMATMLLAAGWLGCVCGPAAAAVRIEGQVQAGGAPLASSTVTLWAATAGEPKQLAQTQTGSDGYFQLGTDETLAADVSLYLIAKGGVATVNNGRGDNTAIALSSHPADWAADTTAITEMIQSLK